MVSNNGTMPAAQLGEPPGAPGSSSPPSFSSSAASSMSLTEVHMLMM